jgi:hypothetical protein
MISNGIKIEKYLMVTSDDGFIEIGIPKPQALSSNRIGTMRNKIRLLYSIDALEIGKRRVGSGGGSVSVPFILLPS